MHDLRIGRCTIAVMLEPFSSETVDSGEVLDSAVRGLPSESRRDVPLNTRDFAPPNLGPSAESAPLI